MPAPAREGLGEQTAAPRLEKGVALLWPSAIRKSAGDGCGGEEKRFQGGKKASRAPGGSEPEEFMSNEKMSVENEAGGRELSLVIPCYNEEKTLVSCVERCRRLQDYGIRLELILVDDCSTDGSFALAKELAARYPEVTVFRHETNRGKGAALRTGFAHARYAYIGIQDADAEYAPLDYLELLPPLLEGKADVVYGSRYLRQDTRRVLYFWHTWMNRSLTFVSNMFTNLDLSDMETCYKCFRREALQEILPLLREDRFGFEPEVTTLAARLKLRVYECAVSYAPRSYEEGKKIGWRDGVRALYCILHYGAPYAPLPMQLLLYFFIGVLCAMLNISLFTAGMVVGAGVSAATLASFFLAAVCNYLLCLALLFRHRSRWSAPGELLAYLAVIGIMGLLDYGITTGLINLGLSPVWSKAWAALTGFVGNFLLRKYLVFGSFWGPVLARRGERS